MTPDCFKDDREHLRQMRSLGAKWPYGHAIPTYPATMSEEQKLAADKHYDAISEAYMDWHSLA
jgi:hypothetical protein